MSEITTVERLGMGGWWVYLVQCGDGSLYCGIARDVDKRMQDHATPKGARYVRSHGGIKAVLWRHETISRSAAQSVEAWVKQLSRASKFALADGRLDLPDRPFGAETITLNREVDAR